MSDLDIRENKTEIKLRFQLIASKAQIAMLEMDGMTEQKLNSILHEITENVYKISYHNWGR